MYPFEIKISLDGKAGKVMLNQCRAIDKSRLGEKIDSLDPKIMKLADEALKIVFALN